MLFFEDNNQDLGHEIRHSEINLYAPNKFKFFQKCSFVRPAKMQEDFKCIGLTRGIITVIVLILREKGDQEVVGWVLYKFPQISIAKSVKHTTFVGCLLLQKCCHLLL
jgi:hypothetical protein